MGDANHIRSSRSMVQMDAAPVSTAACSGLKSIPGRSRMIVSRMDQASSTRGGRLFFSSK